MGRHAKGEKAWLEMHGGKWRVTYSVPKKLQKAIGASKIKLSLRTDSLSVANELKLAVVNDIRNRLRAIERSGDVAGSTERGRVLKEAVSIAEELATTTAEQRDDVIREVIEPRVQQILGTPIGHETLRPSNSEGGADDAEEFDVEFFDPTNRKLADQFVAVALRGRMPIDSVDADYKSVRLRVSPRTRDDHDRALRMLAAFCIEKGRGDDLRSVDEHVVTDFVAYLENVERLQGRTIKKYVSRLNLYFDYAKSVRKVSVNPWRDAKVYMPTAKQSELERPFSEKEMVTLLTGPAKPVMRDLMMIGALTGARLDAIVDLKVDDIVKNRAFRFKPMKRESGERYVPIHPDLMEIVRRRTEGRNAGDDFFPEYPKDSRDPRIERSFRASKHFTTYRRSLKVNDVVAGKRRSRVNFHSFRRWFITKGERTLPPEGMIAALVGHTRKGITLGVYSEGPEMTAARRTMLKIRLPPLDGSPVVEAEAVTPR